MSRSSAKERSRVQDSGRHISTLRVVENFGSWKHKHYLPHDCPSLIPLNRRFIGGKNSGRKLSIEIRVIQIRKPTKRMLAQNESWWGLPLKIETWRYSSNYLNRKRLRQMAKNLLTTEMSAYLESQKEALELERLEEANRLSEKEEIDQYFAEKERAEDVCKIMRDLVVVVSSNPNKWGYHHYF